MCTLFQLLIHSVSIVIAHFCMQYAGYFLYSWICQCLRIYEEVTTYKSPSSMIFYLSTLKNKTSSFLIFAVSGTFSRGSQRQKAFAFLSCLHIAYSPYCSPRTNTATIRLVEAENASKLQGFIPAPACKML